MSRSPHYSDSSRTILDGAVNVARSRGHTTVGTEHLMYSISNCNSRSFIWAAKKAFGGNGPDSPTKLKQKMLAHFSNKPYFRFMISNMSSGAAQDLVISDSLVRVLEYAEQIGVHCTHDGDQLYPHGLVASEFLFAALLFDTNNCGAQAFFEVCGRAVTVAAIFIAIHFDPKTLKTPDVERSRWKNFKWAAKKQIPVRLPAPVLGAVSVATPETETEPEPQPEPETKTEDEIDSNANDPVFHEPTPPVHVQAAGGDDYLYDPVYCSPAWTSCSSGFDDSDPISQDCALTSICHSSVVHTENVSPIDGFADLSISVSIPGKFDFTERVFS